MANLVTGAMSSIIPKLGELLKEEYNLQTSVKDRISYLTQELQHAQTALCKVAEVPWDHLDKEVQIWARKVREASYDMEDVLDIFLVRVKGPESDEEKRSLRKHLKKMTNFFNKSKARRKISGDVKNIMAHLQEVTEQCRRYKVHDIGTSTATTSTIDPRLHAMYTQVNKLVGMDKPSDELMSMLQTNPQPGDVSGTKMKIVSIVGVGGLGKTTLAKVVYDKIKRDFDCTAFVPVGRNADLKKILKDILMDLDKQRYLKYSTAALDERQLIDEFHKFFLEDKKRYFIVIDDLWEKQSWEIIKLATAYDKSYEGRIIITTRKWEVAKNADEVYELPALPPDSSRKLFYTRIYGDERKYFDYQQDDVSDEILRKCAGIPLAIITMASLLVDEPTDRWFELYKSIGFGCKDNEETENIMKKILSFSYYDLPSHLRTCLLYFSAFSEDSFIPKVSLVWMWAAEGFIQKQKGKGWFETGEGYFNDLVNRSLIQEVEQQAPDNDETYIHGCRVHDMVLEFIRSMSWEENFFTVFDDNDEGTIIRSNLVRRLAHHNKSMVLGNQASKFDMLNVRSFIALEWAIDTWAPISSFKLIRVLNIRYYGHWFDYPSHSHIRVEPLGQLVHLRFLGINGRKIEKIPKEIGALKMLQTLDLMDSLVLESPSSSSLSTQLVCLRTVLDYGTCEAEMFSVGRLTSLEELSIKINEHWSMASRRLLKELGNLRELRVFDARICLYEEEVLRDLMESVRHLHKLQHLKIDSTHASSCFDKLRETEFVLLGDLRTLGLCFTLWKLPSCINPLCHRKLSYMDLSLMHMDDQELKTLGRFPELRFLRLGVWCSSPTISNISDSDACYFPKLRWLRLRSSLVLFVANTGDDNKKTVSFHIWNGEEDDRPLSLMPTVSDAELQSDDEFSSMFQWETGRCLFGGKIDDDLQLTNVHVEEKKKGTVSTREGEGGGVVTPRFMPRLQVLHVGVTQLAVKDPRYCDNLGLEFLSSLQEISACIYNVWEKYSSAQEKPVKAALMRAAQVHPNHPTLLRIDTSYPWGAE